MPSPSPQRGSTDSRLRKYAESLLKQFDTNKSLVLEKDEWHGMQSRWHEADRNRDGTITLDELVSHMAQLAQRGSERAGSLAAPSSPPAVRALPPVSQEGPKSSDGQMPQPVRAFPPSGATFPRTVPSGDRSSLPQKPIDPRAPLVSVQLVIAEVVADAAEQAGPKPQPPALSDLGKSPATLPLDLSVPSEKILEELRKLGLRGRLDVLYQIQLTTVDQQSASFQLGQRQPRVVGVSMSQFGQANSVDLLNTGLIVQIQPQVAGGNVATKVTIEESRLGRAEEGIPVSVPSKGEPVRAAPVHSRTLQTAVNAPSGQTIVLSGTTAADGPRKRYLMILLCARIVPSNPSETPRSVR
jgi:hypothetical protein